MIAASDVKKFEGRGVAGELELQLSMGMVLFFGRGLEIHGKQVLALWNELLDWRGREVFSWARLGGGNKSRKMDGPAYRTVEAWLSGTKPCGTTCWIEIHGGDWEEIGAHSFAMEGRGAGDKRVSAVDIRLPVRVSSEETIDALAERFCRLAGHVDFLCGTAGLMLHATPFDRQRLWPEMKKLVMRYEGVEPDIVEDGEYTADFGLTGVNWLTFVGAKYLHLLGGAAAVQTLATQHKNVTVYETGRGLALRAGAHPQLGDRNKGITELLAYRDVYAIVKPVIFADPRYAFDEQHFDGDDTVAWVHRFGRT